jgi:hypothetical protein
MRTSAEILKEITDLCEDGEEIKYYETISLIFLGVDKLEELTWKRSKEVYDSIIAAIHMIVLFMDQPEEFKTRLTQEIKDIKAKNSNEKTR